MSDASQSHIPRDHKFPIPGSEPDYLEDIFYAYGSTVKDISLPHWGIIDKDDVGLMKILERNSWAKIKASYPRPIQFPKYLSIHSYLNVVDVAGCI